MNSKERIKYNNRKDNAKLMEFFVNFVKNNKEIYVLGGELNPDFYQQVVDNCKDVAKDTVVNFICGPFIAIHDDIYRQYHDLHENHLGNWWYAKRKGDWWKSHPIFDIAHNDDNLNIYIVKQRVDNHFCVGLNTNDTVIEDTHDELEDTDPEVHYGDQKLSKQYLEKWETIRDEKCFKWDKNTHTRFLKPIHIFKREQDLEKRIAQDIESPRTFSV